MLVDEKDVTLKDLADMTGAGVRMGVELAALKGLGSIAAVGRLGSASRLGLESAAAAASGELIPLTVDALGSGDTRMADLVTQHAKSVAGGTVAGAAIGGAIKGAVGAKNAIQGKLGGELSPGDTERAGIQGLRQLQTDTGIQILPSIGQIAEDPSVIRLESYLERLPFFGAVFRKNRDIREASIRSLQEKAIGREPLQPMSELGANLADVIQSAAKAPEEQATLLESNIGERAANEIESAITRIAPTARSFTTSGTAALTKLSAQSRMTQFRNMSDQLFSEAGNPEISTAPLKPLLQDIRASLPKKTVIKESDLVDIHGKPLATSEGKEIIRELVPTELQKFLKGLDSLDETMPLDQLRRIRNTVDNAIVEGRGLEGVSTYELKKVRNALTETMDRGAGELGDTGQAILRANSFYRENIERFEVPLVARLLKDSPSDAGFIGNHELINLVRNDPDKFQQIEQFLKGTLTQGGKSVGPNAQRTFDVLRRSLLEDIYSRARVTPGSSGNVINADAFLSEINRFAPEVKSSLLGVEEETLSKNLDLLKQLKSGFKEVPLDSLQSFLRFPANSVEDLSRLATARKKAADIFENEVVSKLLKGEGDFSALRSDQGLDWLMRAKNKGDVAQVMAMASDDPALVESIRANATARVFQEASQKTTAKEAAHLDEASYLVEPSKLIDAFKDKELAAKLKIILGNERFNIVKNFAQSQAVLGKEGSSSLMGQSTATGLLVHALKFFKDVPQAAKITIYSAILSNQNLARSLMEGSLTPGTDAQAFAELMMASVPVLEALSEQYGRTGAELVLQAFRNGVSGQPKQRQSANRGVTNTFSIKK